MAKKATPAEIRAGVFKAFAGDARVDVTGDPSGDILGQLRAVGGSSTRTRSGIDLTAAAAKLGVARRTVERWVKTAQTGQGQRPSLDHAKNLAKKARQVASTQAGRRAALAGLDTRRPATVRINALQGPSERSYMRRRLTQMVLSPDEAEAMAAAWAQGGEKGFLSWATAKWNDGYLEDWKFDLSDVDRHGHAGEVDIDWH